MIWKVPRISDIGNENVRCDVCWDYLDSSCSMPCVSSSTGYDMIRRHNSTHFVYLIVQRIFDPVSVDI